MMRFRWKTAAKTAGCAALVALLAVAAALTLQSSWFYNKVRERIAATVEKATGGRATIGAFSFDWKQLRAEVTGFTLHGTEAPGKPPLFHAGKVTVGLRIASFWKRDVDIRSLEVASPAVYLIVAPDGSTNLPQPKAAQTGSHAMETVLKLAIGRFALANGIFEVESRSRTPFTASGRNLSVSLAYDRAKPRYFGHISVGPLAVQAPGFEPIAWSISTEISAEANRIDIQPAKVAAAGIDLDLSGGVEDFAHPRANFKYALRADIPAVERFLRVNYASRGRIELAGDARWSGASDYSIAGALRVYGLEGRLALARDSTVSIADGRADASLFANPSELTLRALRYSAAANGIAVAGRVETASLRGRDLDLRGLAAGALGGSFQGDARLRNLDRFAASGALSGFDIRRALALYSREPLAWDAVVSGAVDLEGSIKQPDETAVRAALEISPAAEGPPVRGRIAASYSAAARVLDLGNSTLALPHSRIDFSGALGRQLRVHLETRDLNDFLPALGKNARAVPVALVNGSASFDGTATGKLDSLAATGRLAATHAVYNDEALDSLTAEIAASPRGVQLQNATAVHGGLRAQFQLSAALDTWKLEPSSAISGSGTLRNAAVSDIAAALKISVPAQGRVDVTGQITGTIGAPNATADITASKGSVEDQPFDRLMARVSYRNGAIDLTGGQWNAPGQRITLAASYAYAAGGFETGRLSFQVATNGMALAGIRYVQQQRPGAAGALQLTASGAADIAASGGRFAYRIENLDASLSATGLRIGQQAFGDVRLAANSRNGVLRAHLDSNFADSVIQGDGECQLTGDDPGSATITFSKLDFGRLKAWLAPTAELRAAAPDFIGAAEGNLRVEGSFLKPATITAALTIPKFEIAPAFTAAAGAHRFVLNNSGPIVARLANSTVSLESARFTGPSTDLSITGKAALEPKLALDLRAAGQLDLGLLHDFNKDLSASGAAAADASIRGDFSSPQLSGRVAFRNVTFNYADFPNGVSQGAGTVVFSGNRATIQDFSAETGGGKIQLTGFVTYENGAAVFRLHTRAQQMRIRKPEGVSTVSDADLSLSGTTQRSLLSGSISIRRMTFNPETDFSSLIASSAEPVETATQAGFLANMALDVQVTTAPDIQVQSTLTQDVQVEANLRLRGNVANPALLGRVNIIQGQLTFFGTKYQVSDGSISFYNPSRIAPVFDIDLTTKAEGIEITLTIAGPIDHLTLTPSSDSSLNYNDIISLLVSGRPPTSDPALLSQATQGPGSYQQLGASALLGQALAAPVTGRLQRFFGVSSLRIDPTIPGIDANPQARLTLQQQVTPNVTFTYITSVTTTNPQIVQVEWALNSRWSVVALREENGETGLDFYFKKKF